MAAASPLSPQARVELEQPDDSTLLVRLSGQWHLRHGFPSPAAVIERLDSLHAPVRLSFTAQRLDAWDSSLLSFLVSLLQQCPAARVQIDLTGLPDGIQRLMEIARAVPARNDLGAAQRTPPLLDRVGRWALDYVGGGRDFLEFTGEVTVAMGRLLVGRARLRLTDLLILIQDCGVEAIGVVTLISYAVGVILAFMGAIQLQQFGASIYVADLVGIAMVRDMGAMMTAIIMAGRTGASFAAQLGTMKVTQEIDALKTMGISPVEFLVLPRIIALVLMIPLLCLYSDLIGILGGATIGSSMLGLSFAGYIKETEHAINLTQLWGGVIKSVVYGGLIAMAGCLRGFECGDNSSAVGVAATRAVVLGIVLVVVACGIFAVVFNLLGI